MTASCDSEAIRRRMQHLRERMHVEVELLNDDAQRLLEWQYYVARFPWWCLGAAAVAGFWLMPGHTVTPTVKLDEASMDELVHKGEVHQQQQQQQQRATWPRSLLGLAGNVAWQLATGYLGQQASRWSAAMAESQSSQEVEATR